jgi:hypothetical protein
VRIQFIRDSMPSIGTYKRSDSPGSDGPAFDGSSRSGIDVADGLCYGFTEITVGGQR